MDAFYLFNLVNFTKEMTFPFIMEFIFLVIKDTFLQKDIFHNKI